MALTEAEELELLELEEQEAIAAQSKPTGFLQYQGQPIVKQATEAALMGPYNATKSLFQAEPGDVVRHGGTALPVVGGVLGGPIGAAAGELGRQMVGTAFAPEEVPQSALGRAASVVAQGAAINPNIIPGVKPTIEFASKVGGKLVKGASKVAQAFTGSKAADFEQAFKQGVSTYGAPSMPKAQEIFGKTMAKEGIAPRPTLAAALDPQLRVARKTAMEVGTKLQAGEQISAEQALRARQAVDRIIAATPGRDKQTLDALSDLRSQFDDQLAQASGPLKDASRTYREAIVKKAVTRPLRVTKSGDMSAVVPILGSVAGAVSGFGSKDASTGIWTAVGAATATSPLVFGAGATLAGTAVKAASNPQLRQLITAYITKQNGREVRNDR